MTYVAAGASRAGAGREARRNPQNITPTPTARLTENSGTTWKAAPIPDPTATIRLGDKSRKYRRGQVVWITIGYRHQPREKIFAAVVDDV